MKPNAGGAFMITKYAIIAITSLGLLGTAFDFYLKYRVGGMINAAFERFENGRTIQGIHGTTEEMKADIKKVKQALVDHVIAKSHGIKREQIIPLITEKGEATHDKSQTPDGLRGHDG